MPDYHYSPEAEDFVRKTKIMEEVLSSTQETLIKFLISLSAPEKLIVSQEAQSTFLKNPEALKAHYCVPTQDDDEEQEEEDAETVVPPHGENPEGAQGEKYEEEVRSQKSGQHCPFWANESREK